MPGTMSIASPDADDGRRALRAYFADLVSRYHERPATDEEIDAALAEEPSDDLTLPHGLFLLAYGEQGLIGCGGLRLLPAGIGEVTRLFVMPGARRQGLGALLLGELEGAARAPGPTRSTGSRRRSTDLKRPGGAALREMAAFDGPVRGAGTAESWRVETGYAAGQVNTDRAHPEQFTRVPRLQAAQDGQHPTDHAPGHDALVVPLQRLSVQRHHGER